MSFLYCYTNIQKPLKLQQGRDLVSIKYEQKRLKKRKKRTLVSTHSFMRMGINEQVNQCLDTLKEYVRECI